MSHLTDCCGHHYCAECLNHWMKVSPAHSCPFCRTSPFGHIHDKHFDRRVKELTIACTNKAHGCKWTGSLSDLKYHLTSEKGCGYELVTCPLNCDDICERKDLQKHLELDCKCREVPCEHCEKGIQYYLIDHHHTVCRNLPVPCPKGCDKIIRRCDVDYHEAKECVKTPIPCLFSDSGCDVVVKREQYEDHIQKCKEKFMVKAHEKVLQEIQLLKGEIASAKSENQVLHSNLISLQTGLQLNYNNVKILRQQDLQLRSILLNEMTYLHASHNPCERLSLECIRTHLKDQVIHLVPGGECATFRLANYTVHKESGQVWYSPPFYVDKGYKLCLAVHLNGVGAGKGTHVAVYLHQMSGQFDSALSWPFSFDGDIEIRLMKQQKCKNLGITAPLRGSDGFLTPPSRLHSGNKETIVGDFRLRSKSAISPTLLRKKTLEEYDGVAECQIMCVSQVLELPKESTASVSQSVCKLELFCLQKDVNRVVFMDSLILQCRLINNPLTINSPVQLTVSEWERWISDFQNQLQ